MNVYKAMNASGARLKVRRKPFYKKPHRLTMTPRSLTAWRDMKPILFIGNVWVIP